MYEKYQMVFQEDERPSISVSLLLSPFYKTTILLNV